MQQHFRPLTIFRCDKTKSEYLPDFVYRVTRVHQFYGLIDRWVREGKIKLVDAPSSTLKGNGQ